MLLEGRLGQLHVWPEVRGQIDISVGDCCKRGLGCGYINSTQSVSYCIIHYCVYILTDQSFLGWQSVHEHWCSNPAHQPCAAASSEPRQPRFLFHVAQE